MRRILIKAGAIVTSGVLVSQLVLPVLAIGPKFGMMDDKAGSRPGLLNKFFNLSGRAAIGSGTLTAKSGNTVPATLTITKDGQSFMVLVDDKTQLRRRFWGKAQLSEMQVGDLITVIGRWTDANRTTIQAILVRDLSIWKRNGVFFGVITTMAGNTWTVSSPRRGDLTASVSAATNFVNRMGQTIAQTDIKVGNRVRLRGLFDVKARTITEVTQVKDFSLPVKPTP